METIPLADEVTDPDVTDPLVIDTLPETELVGT